MNPQKIDFDTAANDALVTINQACNLTALSTPTIYRRIKAGDLRLVKIGKCSRIRIGDLRKLIGLTA